MEPSEPSESSLVPAAVVFEFSLAGVAALLGWLMGINPFQGLAWRHPMQLVYVLAWGGVGVLPLLVIFRWLQASQLAPARHLRRLLDEQLLPYFARATTLELLWLSLAAGVGEELLFRGFLLSALQTHLDSQAVGGWLPLILSSVLFGLAHFVSWTYLLLATGVGLYLGWLMIATESLWVPVTTHAVYDFVALWWLCGDFNKKRAA